MSTSDKILPGKWLGVLGGGQLGRMFTHAAQRLGYHVAVFENHRNCPAGQAAERLFGALTGQIAVESVSEMAELCSAITLEFENIDKTLVQRAAEITWMHPHADFLAICQDRILEKTTLSEAGFPTTPFVPVTSVADLREAVVKLDLPLVVKTATSGYDGKGQAVVRGHDELEQAWETLGSSHAIAEKWIDFEAEVSLIVARNRSGQVESFPLMENDHANHILDVTRCPSSPQLQTYEREAQDICGGIAHQFEVVGLFCVEFFVSKSGKLLINEIAPRPHNSGHLTIEAFSCSQFEQQLRAICNLPLIPAAQLQPAAMVNLLGDLWRPADPDWSLVLEHPTAHLHLYGKSQARAGRKMGHITVLDPQSSSAAAQQARRLRAAIQ